MKLFTVLFTLVLTTSALAASNSYTCEVDKNHPYEDLGTITLSAKVVKKTISRMEIVER